MTPDQRRIRANDAKHLLDNPMLKDAFNAVDEYLNAAALTCSPDDPIKAQRIVISKQLLAAIRREITRVVEDGTVAEIQLSEIEQRRGLKKFLR